MGYSQSLPRHQTKPFLPLPRLRRRNGLLWSSSFISQNRTSPCAELPKAPRPPQYKAIEEISAKMEQPAGPLEQSDILAELEDALRLMISRWNTCLAHNPDHRSACQAGIRRLAEEGVHYLQTMAQDDAGPSYQTGIPQ